MRYVLALILMFTFYATSAVAGQESDGMAASSADMSDSDKAAHQAHEAYVEAINSNDLDRLMDMLTDDVVYMAPNDKPVVGKDAVRPWVEGYFAAYKTHWDKPVQDFVVNGDWAWERYSYTSTDTPVEGGEPITGSGWGLLIYHHDADGKWRVARDAWGSDQPAQ